MDELYPEVINVGTLSSFIKPEEHPNGFKYTLYVFGSDYTANYYGGYFTHEEARQAELEYSKKTSQH